MDLDNNPNNNNFFLLKKLVKVPFKNVLDIENPKNIMIDNNTNSGIKDISDNNIDFYYKENIYEKKIIIKKTIFLPREQQIKKNKKQEKTGYTK